MKKPKSKLKEQKEEILLEEYKKEKKDVLSRNLPKKEK